MIEKYKKYLPIGSVVLLKNGEKRLMITCAYISTSDGNIYDYNGCLYPEGLISPNNIYLFNHEDIQKIYAVGFSDEEEKLYKNYLEQRINN